MWQKNATIAAGGAGWNMFQLFDFALRKSKKLEKRAMREAGQRFRQA